MSRVFNVDKHFKRKIHEKLTGFSDAKFKVEDHEGAIKLYRSAADIQEKAVKPSLSERIRQWHSPSQTRETNQARSQLLTDVREKRNKANQLEGGKQFQTERRDRLYTEFTEQSKRHKQIQQARQRPKELIPHEEPRVVNISDPHARSIVPRRRVSTSTDFNEYLPKMMNIQSEMGDNRTRIRELEDELRQLKSQKEPLISSLLSTRGSNKRKADEENIESKTQNLRQFKKAHIRKDAELNRIEQGFTRGRRFSVVASGAQDRAVQQLFGRKKPTDPLPSSP